MNVKNRILFVLSCNPKGLGYNDLKLKIPEKSLRKYLPKHIQNGFVEIKKVTCRGGTKHVHFLTDSGIKQLRIMKTKEGLVDRVYHFGRISSLQQKIELFVELISDITILGIEELGFKEFQKMFTKTLTVGLELGTKTMELEIYLDFLREKKTSYEKTAGHEQELRIINKLIDSLATSG